MNDQVEASEVISELLEQLKQANLQIAILKVMLATSKKEQSPALDN